MKLKLLALIGTLSISAAVATNANAATINVGGGVWEYGKNWTHTLAYSNYLHHNNVHSSAVVVGGFTASSGPTAPGEWSLASAEPR